LKKSAAFRPKRLYDPQGTRLRILEVASSAFQTHGYHATSMHDVMHAAGVPGGSVYHHFPSKKSLGLAVIDERIAAAVERTWIEPVRCAKNARDGILAVFETTAKEIDENGGAVSGCPLNNLTLELALVDGDFQAALQRVFAAWERAMAQRLPTDVATFVVATFSGAMALAKATQSAQPLRACARELARTLPKPATKSRR
jgi:AcrR family transcriptional regulator